MSKREDFPAPQQGILVTHFLVVSDIERSARFYSDVLGGKIVREGTPTMVKLANTWIILNEGGGPTPDKASVTLVTPPDPDTVHSFLNIRVADIHSVYEEWGSKGARFLTPPMNNHDMELRCYLRDPDDILIEVGQSTGMLDALGSN